MFTVKDYQSQDKKKVLKSFLYRTSVMNRNDCTHKRQGNLKPV